MGGGCCPLTDPRACTRPVIREPAERYRKWFALRDVSLVPRQNRAHARTVDPATNKSPWSATLRRLFSATLIAPPDANKPDRMRRPVISERVIKLASSVLSGLLRRRWCVRSRPAHGRAGRWWRDREPRSSLSRRARTGWRPRAGTVRGAHRVRTLAAGALHLRR
jgi:hypothetical protein